VLFDDGRAVRIILRGQTSHWDRFYGQQTVLVLDDGFLRSRVLNLFPCLNGRSWGCRFA
jgi:hypothetical protein